MGDVINFPTNEFYYHVYVIGYAKGGPVKIGYSNNPPKRLKELQTGSPNKLSLCGSLGLKDENLARAIEKIILFYLNSEGVQAKGEWYEISIDYALKILQFFPVAKKNLNNPSLNKNFSPLDSTLDLIRYGLNKNLISNDLYDDLIEVFENGDDKDFIFYNFVIN